MKSLGLKEDIFHGFPRLSFKILNSNGTLFNWLCGMNMLIILNTYILQGYRSVMKMSDAMVTVHTGNLRLKESD